jgi:hypothetical protein
MIKRYDKVTCKVAPVLNEAPYKDIQEDRGTVSGILSLSTRCG